MKAFDKIIGYSGVKQELIRIADILKNREIYTALGVSAPRGLLLYGEPGVGKTLMANCLIEASGRNVFICRKNKPNGEFVNSIKETFETAAENAPSIVLLDDMDKFANDDDRHKNAEEYVTVQACIDETRDKEIFVIATVNDLRNLPKSLTREGRFDFEFRMEVPSYEEVEEIITHYLEGVTTVSDIDTKTLAHLLSGKSCAALESVIKAAGMYAGFERAETITMNHIIKACLKTVFYINPADFSDIKGKVDLRSNNNISERIYHEAGHAVVAEILDPECVALASVMGDSHNSGGFVHANASEKVSVYERRLRNIYVSLAGKAAVEVTFGSYDAGASFDIDTAYKELYIMLVHCAMNGFALNDNPFVDSSDNLKLRQETAVSQKLEEYYLKVKEILIQNREFLNKTAEALAEKGYLISSDIQKIKADIKA